MEESKDDDCSSEIRKILVAFSGETLENYLYNKNIEEQFYIIESSFPDLDTEDFIVHCVMLEFHDLAIEVIKITNYNVEELYKFRDIIDTPEFIIFVMKYGIFQHETFFLDIFLSHIEVLIENDIVQNEIINSLKYLQEKLQRCHYIFLVLIIMQRFIYYSTRKCIHILFNVCSLDNSIFLENLPWDDLFADIWNFGIENLPDICAYYNLYAHYLAQHPIKIVENVNTLIQKWNETFNSEEQYVVKLRSTLVVCYVLVLNFSDYMLKIQQQPNTIYDKQLIQCVIVHAINFFIRQVEETAKEFLKNCNFQETIEHYGYYFSECDDTDDEEAYLLSLQKEEEEKEEDQIKISE